MRIASVLAPAIALAIVGSACVARDDAGTSDGADTAAASGASTDDPGSSTSAATGSASAGTADDGPADGSGSTTGDVLACVADSECRTFSDCCSCAAVHIDEVGPPSCDLACDRTMCQLWQTEAFCSHTCVLRLVDCDPALVQCGDDPPDCEGGSQPAVVDRCWTQQCVPVDLCTPY